MILARIEQVGRYACLHPNFVKAVAFLEQTNLTELPLARHEIDGENVYAIAIRGRARTRDQAVLEAHRKYADIQVVLSGIDNMGWKSTPLCNEPRGRYDSEKDAELFNDAPEAWIAVSAGALAIFFPEDAHAPMVGTGQLHKVVVKVAVD